MRVPSPFGEPAANDLDGERGQRRGAFFASFADAVHVADAEVDIAAIESDEFGDPQPGLDGEPEEGVVASISKTTA
jgi:hypothetical protein